MVYRYTLNSSLGEFVVEDAPKGWESKQFTLSRSETYGGIMIAVSADLKFYNDHTMEFGTEGTYDYLDRLDKLEDSEAKCSIKIESLISSVEGWVLEFEGYLNFNKKNQTTQDGKFISFPIYSDNFSKKILERHEIEIPYDRLETLDNEAITPFTNEYQDINVIGLESLDDTELRVLETVNPSGSVWLPSLLSESNASYWNPTTFYNGALPTNDEVVINNNAFFIPTDLNGTINGTINLTVTTTSQAIYAINVYDYKTDGDNNNPIVVYNIAGQVTAVSGDTEILIPIEDYVFTGRTRLIVQFSKASGVVTKINQTSSDFTVISKANTTPCKQVPPFEVATRLIESITGEANAVESSFFGRTDSPITYDEDGKGAFLFASNGKLVRQFPVGYQATDENKVAQLNFSFKEWFENYNKIYNIAAGVVYDENESRYKLVIEDKKYFYSNTVILTITPDMIERDSFSRKRDTTNYYQSIKTGSTFQQPEEISGLEEYNNKESYSGVLVNNNELDLVGSYIYGAYPWEFTRRLPYNGTETEDYKYDNSVMLFQTIRYMSGFIQKTTEGYDTINGIDFITSPINLDLTPQRNLRDNWGWLIKTGYKTKNDSVLKYNTSEYTTDLETKKTGDAYIIKENDDIPIDELETPLFSGNIDRFSAPLPAELFRSLKQGQNGLIKYWNELDEVYTFGWYNQVSTEPATCATTWEMKEAYNFTDSDSAFRLTEDGSFRLLENDGKRLLED